MSDERGLLAAIWDQPHDDVPRLVYADWLQENGGPAEAARGEFIRIQCELARLDEDDPNRAGLEKREKRLWKQFGPEWRAGLPSDLRDSPFRRGFVHPVQWKTTAAKFCELAPDALASAPTWDYYLEGMEDEVLELARSPNLSRVELLSFWTNMTAEGAATVLASPQLVNVVSLSLGFAHEWARGIGALAANPAARHLTSLIVHDGFNDETAATIGGAPGFAGLRALHTQHHKLTPTGLRSIFKSKHLAALTELGLPAWYGEAGAKVIAATRPLFRLRTLVMYGAWLSDAGVAAIANWPGLESVRRLDIGGKAELAGPRALATSPYARNLRELDLSLSQLNRQGALALAKSRTLDLKRLVIRATPAAEDEAAVEALVKRFGKEAVKVRYPGQRKR